MAAARTESYDKDSRKPKEVVYTDLKGDLLRRDFTVNALALDLHPDRFGELHDPHGGIIDIKAKILKTPLNPNETFSEDPLRMMRAALFRGSFEFLRSKKNVLQQYANKLIESASFHRKESPLNF